MREPDPEPTEKPLAAAKARLDRKAGKGRKVSPDLVIGLKAAGVPQTKIGPVLGVTRSTVIRALNSIPDARERIAYLRERLREIKITKAHEVEGKLWSRLEREIDEGEARDVDAMARAILASEKVQASAAGEGTKVEVSGMPQNPVADLKVLIQQIIEK